ncbi:hypothetical protein KUTeg_013009 [Tegillarca granosa]|uniref:Uncharacterized protein n=1 Tax=Tegillarca granosa TaxID=220873 RepID=A0ABQ9ESI7_TEGGR|nr:hypothetical protein KUTeg_013009 [Tegillarca granosa]
MIHFIWKAFNTFFNNVRLKKTFDVLASPHLFCNQCPLIDLHVGAMSMGTFIIFVSKNQSFT